MMLTRQIWSLFSRGERWRLGVLLALLVVRAAVETMGVSAIAPFMSVVADPGVVQTNPWLQASYQALGFGSTRGFLVALGVTVIVVLAVCNAVSALAVWATMRFAWGTHHRLGVRLFRNYLAQPYGVFVERNSASFSKIILDEVRESVNGVLIPALTVVSRGLVVVAISAFLIVLDPPLAAVILVVLGGGYVVLFSLVRKRQHRLGRDRADANLDRFKIAGEAFGGVKDVKVLQREPAFADQFVGASQAYARATSSNMTVAHLPRYLFETIAFGGIVAIVLYFVLDGGGVAQVLPVVSVYAFAGYRLMPELQNLFASVAAVRFSRAALDDLTADLDRFEDRPEVYGPAPAPLALRERVVFDGVSFRYPGAARPALDGVTLEIARNNTVGLVGASGSGKTTLVDVLLGLYAPGAGRILIDGVALDAASVRAWTRNVGYVPQQIFLADDTVAGNVAFGVPAADVDHEQVEAVARQAHLHNFVSSLPDGYQTVVGERGVRLSGGQRQRIGIARALYHDPDVLVMDEATSALDNQTEGAVMEAIGALAGRKTIVLIAHRLTTVASCDWIYLLADGRVADEGTFADLATDSTAFRSLAQLEPSAS